MPLMSNGLCCMNVGSTEIAFHGAVSTGAAQSLRVVRRARARVCRDDGTSQGTGTMVAASWEFPCMDSEDSDVKWAMTSFGYLFVFTG
jgi:hypothetical protein